jgi:hypothetical protein
MDKINAEVINVHITPADRDAQEILDSIKGSFFLYLIETRGFNRTYFNEQITQFTIYSLIREDQKLFNDLTTLICNSFFEGFNTQNFWLLFRYIVNLNFLI